MLKQKHSVHKRYVGVQALALAIMTDYVLLLPV